jgi:hypothetical protein
MKLGKSSLVKGSKTRRVIPSKPPKNWAQSRSHVPEQRSFSSFNSRVKIWACRSET